MQVPIFKDCEPSFTARLVELLQPRLYAPRDIIIFEGELGKEMYFIVRGSVEIEIGGSVVNTLGAMQYFGELALYVRGASEWLFCTAWARLSDQALAPSLQALQHSTYRDDTCCQLL